MATQSAILIADIKAPATLFAIPLPSFAMTGTPTYKLSQVETPRRAETDRGRCRLVGKLPDVPLGRLIPRGISDPALFRGMQIFPKAYPGWRHRRSGDP
jgi:hypothetical protein